MNQTLANTIAGIGMSALIVAGGISYSDSISVPQEQKIIKKLSDGPLTATSTLEITYIGKNVTVVTYGDIVKDLQELDRRKAEDVKNGVGADKIASWDGLRKSLADMDDSIKALK